jgi:16S rRNA (cytosine1402-N4)-methyltransferase
MSGHITVMEREAVSALNAKRGSVFVDATANGGGHTAKLAETIGNEGAVIAIDVDPAACRVLTERFRDVPQVKVRQANFRELARVVADEGIAQVDGVLADLGWSTNQFESAQGYEGRGFSFQRDEPLLMTYGDPKAYPFTARDIVNGWKEEDIANVLYGYAEERSSRKIARAIVTAREKQPIETSCQLSQVIEEAIPRRGKLHPATKTFQGLRIAVNDELGALEDLVRDGIRALAPRGVMAIITFHSIEDRIVKRMFKEAEVAGTGIPIKKPVAPSKEEIRKNPRARSAKLRTFTRTT